MKQNRGLDEFLNSARHEVDVALDRYLPRPEGFGLRLHEAMRHSVFSGGKRLRPCLCLLVNESLGGERRRAMRPACALEMVHTYSLIHDDLPAMDDDDLRRGQPTCHKAFDEATAILAGDGLLTLAFETVAHGALPPATTATVVQILSAAAGPSGMVLGQMRDLLAERAALTAAKRGIAAVEAIHLTKTAAMIAASIEIGAVTAGADDGKRRLLARSGRHVGLAFQIIDDILDVTASTSQLGKTAGKDLAGGKATYPATIGLDASRAAAQRETAAAIDLIPTEKEFALLVGLIQKMLVRTY